MKQEQNLQLWSFRQAINQIDNDIIDLIEERFNLMPELWNFKKENWLEVEHQDREKEIYKKYKKLAEEKWLDAQIIVKIFFNIIEESKKIQSESFK